MVSILVSDITAGVHRVAFSSALFDHLGNDIHGISFSSSSEIELNRSINDQIRRIILHDIIPLFSRIDL